MVFIAVLAIESSFAEAAAADSPPAGSTSNVTVTLPGSMFFTLTRLAGIPIALAASSAKASSIAARFCATYAKSMARDTVAFGLGGVFVV